MQDRLLEPAEVSDRKRDAHTIKGNALVMGYPHMADGAKLLERLFREVEDGNRAQDTELGEAIEGVATQFEDALDAELEGYPEELMTAVNRLRVVIGELDAPSPDPVAESRPSTPLEVGSAAENLGGLMNELELVLGGDSTRVETSRMYQLINRAVELRLDAEAMSEAAGALHREVERGASGAAAASVRLGFAVDRFHESVLQLQEEALRLPSVQFDEVTSTFDQLVRFLARRLNKDVRLRVVGDDVAVDRQLVDRLREPLRHLVVNAVHHGIESAAERVNASKPPTGSVVVEVAAVERQLQVSVTDDGRGIDWEAVAEVARTKGLIGPERPSKTALQRMLFMTGFTTVGSPDDVSGDGTGLAMAAELVEALNGGIAVGTASGRGTTVRMTLPSSLALQEVLVVEAGGQQWGIPVAAVDSTVVVVGDSLDGVRYQDTRVPVASLAAVLGLAEIAQAGKVIVITSRTGVHAFSVATVVGRRQVAVKALGPMLGGSPLIAGVAVLGGGTFIGILEPRGLTSVATKPPSSARPRLLVVDDSRGVRQLVAATLGSAGFEVVPASDAAEAVKALEHGTFDAVVCDFSMPGPNGVELVKLMRKRLPSIPVVMVSAVASPEDQSAAYAAGVNAYLDKSDFREGVLAITLKSLLGMTESKATP